MPFYLQPATSSSVCHQEVYQCAVLCTIEAKLPDGIYYYIGMQCTAALAEQTCSIWAEDSFRLGALCAEVKFDV